MADHIATRVSEGLFEHLRTMPGRPPVAWPSVPFTPPRDANGKALPWLRANDLPAEPEDFGLGADAAIRRGVLQVSVFWPEGQGITAPKELAGAVADRFRVKTVIEREGVRVRIRKTPHVATEIQEPGLVQVPVSISYEVIS